MTFEQLQRQFAQHPHLEACASFLDAHAQVIRDLFYNGIGDKEEDALSQATAQDFEAEQALIDFLNSRCGDKLRSGVPPPPQVTALLIYFISLCERAGFHHRILQIAQVLPPGSLRSRAEAVFYYKSISRASIDYVARFERIAETLQTAWLTGARPQQAQCEDMAIEYFCSAAAPECGIGDANRALLTAAFSDRRNIVVFPLLRSVRVLDLMALPAARLPQEREDAQDRIAEAFYDEAALLLPVPPPPPAPTLCLSSGRSHAGHCPPGLHAARAEIQARFPAEYANTARFITQPLDAARYTEFNDVTKCMRYFRQYMPLHMPQVEQAVCQTLDGHHLPRKRINVIDIGGGPGTLYTVLASILRRTPYQDYKFDVTLVEPSTCFHDFLRIVAKHVTHPNLTLREICACTSDDMPTVLTKKDADWYFIANAITPIVKGAGGDATRAIDNLCEAIKATRRKHSPCTLTIAENTKSADFPAVLAAISSHGFPCTSAQAVCNGAWLKDCSFRVAYSSAQTPAPHLKYACVQISEGALAP